MFWRSVLSHASVRRVRFALATAADCTAGHSGSLGLARSLDRSVHGRWRGRPTIAAPLYLCGWHPPRRHDGCARSQRG